MKFEEISIGYKTSLTHKITKEDIEKFVDLTGDDNKLHVDERFAATTSFKKPVVHGMIGASFISTIIGTKIPGDGALWFSQTLEFLLPVRIGDEIKVTAEVVKKSERDRIIELDVNIYNQNRQVVTRGKSKVKVIEQQEAKTEDIKIVEPKCRAALVLGATGGIGEQTCIRLAEDGCNIGIHYFSNKSKALKLQQRLLDMGVVAHLFQANIFDDNSIAEMFEQLYRKFEDIDVFVNCAATAIPPIPVMELEWSDFNTQIDLNVVVNFKIIKRLLPSMVNNKYGKIVTLGSLASDKPNTGWAHYITAKAALEGMTRALAIELSPMKINVNMVSPSMIDTDLTSDIPEKIKLLTAAQTPLRRLALADDVANAICYLASDRSSFLSGEVIRVNGGQLMK